MPAREVVQAGFSCLSPEVLSSEVLLRGGSDSARVVLEVEVKGSWTSEERMK